MNEADTLEIRSSIEEINYAYCALVKLLSKAGKLTKNERYGVYIINHGLSRSLTAQIRKLEAYPMQEESLS